MGEVAVLGKEFAAELIARGFEVYEIKRGKYNTIYYFNDSAALLAALNELTEIKNKKN